MANIKIHVFNLELKSHDSFDGKEEAAELVDYFIKQGYKKLDICIISGERLDYKVELDTCSTTDDDTVPANR